ERVLPPRPRPPVDRVLQRAGDRAVVLRGDEEDAVRRLDRLLEGSALRRVVGVVVPAVQRKVLDRDLGELEVVRRERDERSREGPVDRPGREAADEVADPERGHGALLTCAPSGRTAGSTIVRLSAGPVAAGDAPMAARPTAPDQGLVGQSHRATLARVDDLRTGGPR